MRKSREREERQREKARPSESIGALGCLFVLVLCAGLVSFLWDARGPIACWMDDEIGSLGRTCAQQKIQGSSEYDRFEIVEVTGITNLSENEKRVEFIFRPKPTVQNPRPQPSATWTKFRKYDDGWRLEP